MSCAIDLYPQETSDVVHLARAAKEDRVLISNDQGHGSHREPLARGGRVFRGLILWPQQHYKRMSIGELVAEIEALTEPFPHPVIYIKPRA